MDRPKELFRHFKRLGIYEWKHVFDIARKDIDKEIMALIFSDTELFERPIYLPELRKILQGHRRKTQLQSPTAISVEIFDALYSAGKNSQ